MSRKSGFSLIELLIVVAIILIIAATALPNLIRAKIAANEASAISSLRTLSTAELTYKISYPTIGYTNLATLGGPDPCTPSTTAGCLIDTVLAGGQKSGYAFAVTPSSGAGTIMDQYLITAVPQNPGISGTKGFCQIEDHVINFITPANGAATRAVCDGGTYLPVQ